MIHHKRTRIVATIGPASATVATLKKMMKAGMNVCRLNFSHGTYPQHRKLAANIRKAAKETGSTISILQDLSGPKLRVGDVGEHGVVLKRDQEIVVGSVARKGVIQVQYPYLERDVKVGEMILLDDGNLELKVIKKNVKGLTCKVVVGGVLLSHKGFNLPDSKLSIASITAKDKKDVVFGLSLGVDIVSLSFVRAAKDIKQLRALIHKETSGVMPLIVAKIEKQEALEHLEEIIDVADGIMVARGDLGVETPAADVPLHQKRIIALCREAGKPVIVATEMLGSMVSKPRPTRAEVSDVANAVIDHADAVMLSGESASGEYPVEAVTMMAQIAIETEKSVLDDILVCSTVDVARKTSRDAGTIMGLLANRGDVHAVIVAPDALSFVSQISYFRPHIPVIAGAPSGELARQAQMYWGTSVIYPVAHGELLLKKIMLQARKLELKQTDLVAYIDRHWKGFEVIVAPFKEILAHIHH